MCKGGSAAGAGVLDVMKVNIQVLSYLEPGLWGVGELMQLPFKGYTRCVVNISQFEAFTVDG